MGKKCLIWTCHSTTNSKNVTFHRLGKTRRYKSWLKAIGKSIKDNISINSCICSRHFEQTDFVIKDKRIYLKENAVPKLFLPPNVSFRNRKPLLQTSSPLSSRLQFMTVIDDSAGTSSDEDEQPQKRSNSPYNEYEKEPNTVVIEVSDSDGIDYSSHDIDVAFRAEMDCKKSQKTIADLRRKVKNLQKTNRALTKKVHCLKSFFCYLEKNNFLNQYAAAAIKAVMSGRTEPP